MSETKTNAVKEVETKKESRLAPFFHVLDKVMDVVVTAALIGVMLVVVAQIVGRLINMPVPWTEEVSRYAFIWMMFIGVAASMRRSDAARVTVFIQLLPRAGKAVAKYLYLAISILFFLFMIVTGGQLVWQQIFMNEMGTAIMIPMWLIGICLPVSGVLGIVCTIGNLIMDPQILEGEVQP